jgi:hypothetical protein
MKLAFKNRGFGFSEKEVEIILNIGTLEAVCKDLGIEFFEIGNKAKVSPGDFRTELLYQGFVIAYKERILQARKRGRIALFVELFNRPFFGKEKAIIWNEHLSQSALNEFNDKVNFLMGEISQTTVKKKVKSRSK